MEKGPGNAKAETAELPPSYSDITTPFGLEQLKTLDRIDVHNKNVTTKHGEVIFVQKREIIQKGCKYYIRFDLYDKTGRMAISFRPKTKCFSWRMEVQVAEAPAARLTKPCNLACSDALHVADPSTGTKILHIKMPSFGQRLFVITVTKGHERQCDIGYITKKWNGVAEELFSDSNLLEVNFPVNLEVQYKAGVIGICVLLIQASNYQYYQ